MMKKLKPLCALALALCLLLGGAQASVLGLDGVLSTYLDINGDVRFSLGMEIKTLMPFGEETVQMLNGILKHVKVNASIQGGEGETISALQLGVDGQSVLDMTETQGAGGTALQTSLLKNRTLTSVGSAMDRLSGNKAGVEAPFDIFGAISEVEGCYRELTNAIIPYAEEKKASYKIKSIGSSRWSRIARLTPEQSEALSPLIAAVLGCGMDEQYRGLLGQMTYQKGFVVGLYQTEQGGKDMAVYMKGNVEFPDGTARKLAYQWAFVNEGTERKDTYKFELTTAKAPSDNRVIAAAYSQKQFTDRFGIAGSCETTLKNPDGTVTTTLKHDLSGQDTDGVRDVTGSVTTTVKTTVDGDTETVVTTVKPEVRLTSAEGSGVLSGTVGLEEKIGKKVFKEIGFSFDEEPAQALAAAADSGELFAVAEGGDSEALPMPESSLIQNEDEIEDAPPGVGEYLVGKAPIGLKNYTVPDSMQTIDLDGASDAQLESLLGELSQNLAGRLLMALAKLPGEDTALLADGMTAADYAAFLELMNSL